ncbi:MAG: MarC family protein [Verrucomicrobiae bacterium]|nr:MarC family protein [Verrucomicrobiae bacterium]
MNLFEYSLLAFTSLFVIVDPISAVPAMLAMTARDSVAARVRMVRLACVVAVGVLVTFTLAGRWIFKFLGITLPAFQIAGSLLLMRVALDMLQARASATRQTDEEVLAGSAKDDIAITPLAVPILAGPGAISTALILLNQAQGWEQVIALLVCIAAVGAVSYGILALAARGIGQLGPLALKLVTRLMGLLLAAVGVQFILNALEQVGFLRK